MKPTLLNVERLESRQMLSSVEIFAAGTTGQENLDLFIDDQFVTTFFSVGGDVDARSFQRFVFETPESLQGSTIGIRFANDFYDPDRGIDSNLLVDRIVVDGVNFETEAPTTRSTGIFRNGLTGPGQFETELFNINATFSFDIPQGASAGSTIAFDALGTTGDEIVSLDINGVTVDSFTFDAANQQQTFLFETDEFVAIEDLQIRFVNDLFDPAAGIDRNVQIFEYSVTDNETGSVEVSNTSDGDVLSDGIFVNGVGITSGFGAGGFLAGNGSVQTIRSTGGLNPEVDSSFGSNGLAAVPEVFDTNFGIFLDNTPEAVGFGPAGEVALANGSSIALFDANGQAITSFGDQGVVELRPLLVDLTVNGGIVFQTTSGEQLYVNSVNFFADGSILLSGAADNTGNSRFRTGAFSSSPFVLKLNPDGSVDTSFIEDGILDDSFFDLNSTQNDVASAIDDQGRTFLFGSIQQTPSFGGTPKEFAIARLNPDGSFDTSFGFEDTGNAFLPSTLFNNATTSRVLGVAIDSQGRAIAGVASPTEVTLIRFNEDGSTDFSFGDQGLVVTSIDNNNVVTSFELDSQDRVVFGQSADSNSGNNSLVYRFLANGQLDASFGVNGILAVAPSPGTLAAQNAAESTPNLRSLALDQDDNIVLAAEIQSADGTQSLGLLQRVTSDGQIDRDFGVDGSFVLPFEPLEPFRPFDFTFRLDSYEAGIAFDANGDLIVTTADGLRRVNLS